MLSWLQVNAATIAVALLLLAIVLCIVRSLVRNRRAGRSSCGGNCAGCRACAQRQYRGGPYEEKGGHLCRKEM